MKSIPPGTTVEQFIANKGGWVRIGLRRTPWLQSQWNRFWQDIESVANWALVKTYRKHEPQKGAVSTLAIRILGNDFVKLERSLRCRKNRSMPDLPDGLAVQSECPLERMARAEVTAELQEVAERWTPTEAKQLDLFSTIELPNTSTNETEDATCA